MSIHIHIDYDDSGLTIDDLLGEITPWSVAYSSNRYTLGTEQMSADEIESIAEDRRYWSAPVYAYIHSGVTISMGKFGCPWDSGQSGIVYAEKVEIAKSLGHKRWNQHTAARAQKIATSIIEELDLILRGEIYRYEITDDDGTHLDSCGGFVGKDHCREDAESAAAYYRAEKQRTADLRTAAATMDSASL